MKYEITKGAKEEFELAPEWATLVVAGRHYSKAWISHYANGARALAFGTKDEYVIEAIHDCEIIAERRPITEPVWDGEGLPPVGVECDWLDNRETYMPVKIMYSSKDAVVIRVRSQAFNEDVDIPLDPVFEPARCKFRPIRSPEDVVRDEAIEAMRDVGYTLPAAIRFTKEEMAALYDAGYRKME